MKYEQLLHQHQDLANQHLGDIREQERCTRVLECWSGRPKEKGTKRAGAIGASGRNCQTAPRVCICVLRSTSTSRQNPKPGQIDLWPPSRYGQRGDDPLKSVRQRTREKRRRQTIAHRQCRQMPALSAYLPYIPTKYSHPSHSAVYRTSTQAGYGQGSWTSRVEGFSSRSQRGGPGGRPIDCLRTAVVERRDLPRRQSCSPSLNSNPDHDRSWSPGSSKSPSYPPVNKAWIRNLASRT